MTAELYKFCPKCGAVMEPRTVFDRIRAVCPVCGFIHFTDPKVAVGVLIEKDGNVLLVRRINEPQRGKWSFPAGFMDAYENPEDAACRECLEETGFEVKLLDVVKVVGGREHPNGADIVIVYRAEVIGGELRPGDDADQAAFFPLDDLPPLAFRATRAALGLE